MCIHNDIVINVFECVFTDPNKISYSNYEIIPRLWLHVLKNKPKKCLKDDKAYQIFIKLFPLLILVYS